MRRLALFVLLAGCGGSTDAPPSSTTDSEIASDSSTPADTSTELDALATDTATTPDTPSDTLPDDTGITFGPYPEGPYGNKLGDVVANLTWEGYVNPTADGLANTKPYVTSDLDKLRRDAKRGYALVHVSEFF